MINILHLLIIAIFKLNNNFYLMLDLIMYLAIRFYFTLKYNHEN